MPEQEPTSFITIKDLAGLQKPCVTLIEKISEALGSAYRPKQIVKIAKAEAEAAVIKAHSEIQITDIKRRALLRFEEEQTQYQINMEATLKKALPLIHEDAKPENIDKDWLTYFFEKSRFTSDEEMQNLWAQILAGEANQPASFSRRTLSFIGDMDKKDAKCFTSLGGFVCELDQEPLLLIYDHNNPIYQRHGITHATLIHLESLNLIVQATHGFCKRGYGRNIQVNYLGEGMVLTIPPALQTEFRIGKVMLTPLGKELLPICGRQKVDGFMQYLSSCWNVTQIPNAP